MIDLTPLTAAIVMGGLVYLASRAEGYINRLVTLKEQTHALQEQQFEQDKARAQRAAEIDLAIRTPMPRDIQMLINGESEKWAREELQQRAISLYISLGDWDKVRSTLADETGEF